MHQPREAAANICAYLDLEVAKPSGGNRRAETLASSAPSGSLPVLTSLGAIRDDRSEPFYFRIRGLNVHEGLRALADFCQGANVLIGHNLRQFDLKVLEPFPEARSLFAMPVVDTLELSPLAFPRNPYHRLVKDYKLLSVARNDPVSDARLCQQLFLEQLKALACLPRDLKALYRHLMAAAGTDYDAMFALLGAPALSPGGAREHLERHLSFPSVASGRKRSGADSSPFPQVCATGIGPVLACVEEDPSLRPALAYVLAWLTTLGEDPWREANSVLPGWVRLAHPHAASFIQRLREQDCARADCLWCRRSHDLEGGLKAFFGFDAFRKNGDGLPGSLQRDIVEAQVRGTHTIAVLPTGGGKSICFQLPALLKAARGKVLTLIISPLQSLMKDQVDVLRNRHGIPNVAALYGGLNPLERAQVLSGVAQGDYDLCYVAPEQLRNASFRQAISRRQVAAWIIDEAHCLSKWGHDFRPDYLYIGRFIREFTTDARQDPPLIGCFTATARPEALEEIEAHFKKFLGISLELFEGSPRRDNLAYQVLAATGATKPIQCRDLLERHIRPDGSIGVALIYASTRKTTEKLSAALKEAGWPAEYYHAGREHDRQEIQDRFIQGQIPVIVATNAFGMGVDKENVRLVIHADIPGSLEAYLQEAGRAGRDRKEAVCVLLYDPQDVDTQFQLHGTNRITLKDVQELLRGARALRDRLRQDEVVITSGELLREGINPDISMDEPQADTKVRTALLVLEEGQFLERRENRYGVFTGKLRFQKMHEAARRLDEAGVTGEMLQQCLRVCRALVRKEEDELLNSDQLSVELGLSPSQLLTVMRTLKRAGLSTLSLQLTALITRGGPRDASMRLKRWQRLEREVATAMVESYDLPPDLDVSRGVPLELNLRRLADELRQAASVEEKVEDVSAAPPETSSTKTATPAELRQLLFSMRHEGILRLTRVGDDRFQVTFVGPLHALKSTVQSYHEVLNVVFEALGRAKSVEREREGAEGAARSRSMVSFTLDDLEEALEAGLFTRSLSRLKERSQQALLTLHRLGVIVLQGGLTVLRPAMTLRLSGKGAVTRRHFEPLEQLYRSQAMHIHVMSRYARLGLSAMPRAENFVQAYFREHEDDFLRQHFPGEEGALERPVTPEQYEKVVTSLGDIVQQRIVETRERALLVLAGPGSGKTRVVVHRVAFLLLVKRVPPSHVLVLAFNRSAVREVRRRLEALIGPLSRGVGVYTYHRLAMSIVGVDLSSERVRRELFAEDAARDADDRARLVQLEKVIDCASELLERGSELGGALLEAEEWRSRLVAWRYLFVDEYQDVSQSQYRLIRALTGAHLLATEGSAEDQRLTLMAVGDDDQSIYAFAGANVAYLKRFEEDYEARREHLPTNFRSSPSIVAASSALIALNHDRMKEGVALRAFRSTRGAAVRIVKVSRRVEAARALVGILEAWTSNSTSSRIAVLARHHFQLSGLEQMCLEAGLRVRLLENERLPFYRLRPVRQLIDTISGGDRAPVDKARLRSLVEALYQGRPLDAVGVELLAVVDDWAIEVGDQVATARSFIDCLYDRGRDLKSSLEQRITLATLHAAKGLEFDAVVVWSGRLRSEANREEERRLFYVGMTRARDSLVLLDEDGSSSPFVEEVRRGAPGDVCLERLRPVVRAEDLRAVACEVWELTLRDVVISFPAYRLMGETGILLRTLEPGDSLSLRYPPHFTQEISPDTDHDLAPCRTPETKSEPLPRDARVSLLCRGAEIGQLSSVATAELRRRFQKRMKVKSVRVSAVVVMDRKPEGREPVESWPLVVPQIVLEPST